MTEEHETATKETALVPRQELNTSIWRMFQEIDQATYESRRFGATRGETAIKLIFCLENGLPLSAANTGLYVVNGRLGVMGNVIAASIRRHPDYDYKIVSLDDKGCTIAILRRNIGGEMVEYHRASFTETMAKRAGLLGKDNWKAYPEDMFFNRAISRAYKLHCPDIFSQPVYVPEELDGNNAIEGEWSVADTQYEAAAPTLETLLTQYSAEQIMEANEGRIPGTGEEVRAVAEKLATKEEEAE